MLYGAWLILIALGLVLPIGVIWLASHFIMEDDQFRYALFFYVVAMLLFAGTSAALIWAGGFVANEPAMGLTMYGAILAVFVFAYIAVAAKIYHSGPWWALVYGSLTLAAIGGVWFGTLRAIESLPVGRVFEQQFGETAKYTAAREAWGTAFVTLTSWRGDAAAFFQPRPEDVDVQDAPFASAETELTEEEEARVAEESAPEPEPMAAPEPEEPAVEVAQTEEEVAPEVEEPPATAFAVGDVVAIIREISIPTQYGKFTLNAGDEVELLEEVSTGTWRVKRGMLDFEMAEADLEAK
ncbi:MAG: hypothetical protein AAGK14_06380 [Verrucomicrobiota bacterium]